MIDNNINRTVVRKEDLHQEVGTLREAKSGAPINLPGANHVVEHNYQTTTISRKEGMSESENSHKPDYSSPLPSYIGPAISSAAQTQSHSNSAPATSHSMKEDYQHKSKSMAQDSKRHSDVSLHKVSDVGGSKGTGAGSKLLKALAILAILVALFFLSIGIVKFVPKAIGSLSGASVYLSNLFTKDGIELITDKDDIRSGETVTVSWKNNSEKTGLYTWSFKCEDGLTVLYRNSEGQMRPVICETSFPIPQDAISYPFAINSLKPGETEMTMTLSLFNEADKALLYSDSKEITVTNSSSQQNQSNHPATSTPAYNPPISQATTSPSNQTAPRPSTAVHVGPTDISVSLVQASSIAAGSIDIKDLTNVSPSDKVIIRFKVANNGANASGPWRLTALLPTTVISDQAYVSKVQPSLAPESSYTMTLMFDNYDPSKKQIAVTIENTGDTNSQNNIITIPINGGLNTGSGRADLAVRIIDVGIMDRYTNAFYSTRNFSQHDKIAVKFEVENKGGLPTNYWSMRVDLPTSGDDRFNYGPFTTLVPGQKTQFTLGFDYPDTGNQTITVRVDSGNSVSESNENNNQDSESLNIRR